MISTVYVGLVARALVFATALGASWVSPAVAQGLALEWHAPTACPTASELTARVEALVGAPLSEFPAVTAVGSVRHGPSGVFELVLELTTPGGHGARTVEAQSCDAIVRVAAFAIALAVNPELTTPTRESARAFPDVEPPAGAAVSQPVASQPVPAEPAALPEPLPIPAAPAWAPPPTVAADTSAPAPSETPEAPPPSLWVMGGAAFDTGLLPQLAAGLGGSIDALVAPAWSVGLQGKAFFEQDMLLSSGTGAEFWAWQVQARGCALLGQTLQAALCPSLGVAQEHGKGEHVDQALSQTSSFGFAGLTGQLALRISESWRGVLNLEALVPWSHDEFTLAGEPVHEVPWVTFQFGLGVSARVF